MSFETKDSGERATFSSGMQRDTSEGKPRYDLMLPLDSEYREETVRELMALLGLDVLNDPWTEHHTRLSQFLLWWYGVEPALPLFRIMVGFDGTLLQRFAELLARGAEKYDARNWEKANGPEELERFRISAFRHFIQYLRGDLDEDHASAVVFNVRAHDWLAAKLSNDTRYREAITRLETRGGDLERAEDPYEPRKYWLDEYGKLNTCDCVHFPECYDETGVACNKDSEGRVLRRDGTVI